MTRQLRSGPGWRVGWNPNPITFSALVGADDWAIELTQSEFEDFCQFAQQLSQTMVQMQAELMDQEKIVCEASSDRLWMEVRGYPDRYQLNFIVLTGRRAEGSWPAEVTPEILRVIQMMQVF